MRLDIGANARWLFVRPVAGAPEVFAVESPEHGYALRLDLAQHRVDVVEPTPLPRKHVIIPIAIGQDGRTACAVIRMVPEGNGWVWSGEQEKCP